VQLGIPGPEADHLGLRIELGLCGLQLVGGLGEVLVELRFPAVLFVLENLAVPDALLDEQVARALALVRGLGFGSFFCSFAALS